MGWAWFGNWFYFDNEGRMLINKWARIDNKLYYFRGDGAQTKRTNFQDINGERYFIKDDKQRFSNEWREVEST